ncbi:MAG: putative glycoprotein [Hailar virus]|uniref:Glycoprotein n=1 Tax=Hailar virus TaxID=3070921 RepID=A0AA49AR68_9VIRU|nr:MAG: putative glycoprotein [Inner Mongolia sediment arena-like virus]QYK37505.1 MAG: putative glycoprotein [Hailar virus]
MVNFAVYQTTIFTYCRSVSNPKCVSSKRQATTVSYIDSTIFVVSPDQPHTFVLWYLNEFTGSFLCSENCQFELPKAYLVKDGILTVKVFILDSLVQASTFNIKASETCQIRDCTFICLDYFTNFVCYSTTTQAIIGFVFISVIILLIALMSFISYKIYCCINRMYTFKVTPDPRMAAALCILLCLSPASAACISTTTVAIPTTQCTLLNGNYTCQTSLNANINLLHLGDTACFRFTNQQGDTIGTLNVLYDLSLYVAPLSPIYYTSDWLGLSCSHKSCRNDHPCSLSDGCPSDSTLLNSVLTPQCVVYPGRTKCESSCGCAGCGCFFCSDACLISRAAFQPVGLPYQVKTIGSVSVYPRLTVEYNFNGTTVSSTSDLFNPLSTPDFTLNLVGSYQAATTSISLGAAAFSSDGASALYYSYSDYNNPQFGVIGDVQSSLINGFSNPPYNFIFPDSSISQITSSSSVDYQFPQSGISRARQTPFPLLKDGIIYTADSERLYGLNPNAPAITVAMSSSHTSFSLVSETVCPKYVSHSISGCYNCPQGFTITFNAFSACRPGSVSVVVEGNFLCTTSFVTLNTTSLPSILYCISQQKQIEGTIKLLGDTEEHFPVLTVLNEAPPLSPNDFQRFYGNFTPTFNSAANFWDSLTGSAFIAKYAVVAGLSAVALVAIIAMIVTTYNWFKAREIYQTFNKYVNV